jgi:IS5 family transposase
MQKSVHLTRIMRMYRALDQPDFPNFYLPFGGKLDPQNRWVKLAHLIPWKVIEAEYCQNFADSGMGAPALDSRIALGALIIKECLCLTDEETVAQIRETPCIQYFLGLHEYLQENLFDPSIMVHFRKRISPESIAKINNAIIQRSQPPQKNNDDDTAPPSQNSDEPNDLTTPAIEPEPPQSPAPNNGQLLIDASCTPADITYPTDLKLLNEALGKS